MAFVFLPLNPSITAYSAIMPSKMTKFARTWLR